MATISTASPQLVNSLKSSDLQNIHYTAPPMPCPDKETEILSKASKHIQNLPNSMTFPK